MENNTKISFSESLNFLINKTCWGVIAGEGTGSTISLQIGNKVPLEKISNNSSLCEDLRTYEGEIVLFIQCAWRLDSSDEVITGCWEDNSKDGSMLMGLQEIIGKSIMSIKTVSPIMDLEVNFSNSIILRIFCDQTSIIENEENYSLFLGDNIFTVGARGVLEEGLRYDD